MIASKRQKNVPPAGIRVARRRTINRPSGTFAHFLDALISYDYAYFRPTEAGFTRYKEDLAAHLGIKPRHFSRLLSGEVLPEIRLLRKLSERFPHVQAEGWIPKLKWVCVEKEMELLPDGSVISIFVGHLTAEGVDALDQMVVRNIARTMFHRSFKYAYVLAPLSPRLRQDELSPTQLADRLRLRILSGWLDANPQAKRDRHAEKIIEQRLMVFATTGRDEAGHFWSFLPRYLAASNLLADPGSPFSRHQFSIAFDSGSVPYPASEANIREHVPQPVATGGWTYLEDLYELSFREMFKKMEAGGLFASPEDKRRKFPRPD